MACLRVSLCSSCSIYADNCAGYSCTRQVPHGYGNLRIAHGTLRASKQFPTDGRRYVRWDNSVTPPHAPPPPPFVFGGTVKLEDIDGVRAPSLPPRRGGEGGEAPPSASVL